VILVPGIACDDGPFGKVSFRGSHCFDARRLQSQSAAAARSFSRTHCARSRSGTRAAAAASAGNSPATELPLNTVDSVMLRPSTGRAGVDRDSRFGTALTPGWTDAKLTEEPEGTDASVKTYRFVATSPEMPDEKRTPQSMEAEVRIDMLSPDVKAIRIVSATNEVSAPIAQ
jgi:hypothetical protein